MSVDSDYSAKYGCSAPFISYLLGTVLSRQFVSINFSSQKLIFRFFMVINMQGHHLDLRLVRNQWLLIDPKVEFLMSEANEEKTSGDFREMGQRLAQEVVSFVKKKMDKVSRSGVLRTIKLSFVGHSIGNIILRTALTGMGFEASTYLD